MKVKQKQLINRGFRLVSLRRIIMKPFAYEGYYDGKNIVTDAKLKKDQKVRIIPIDSPAGSLHQYADISKIPHEREVFANEIIKRHN